MKINKKNARRLIVHASGLDRRAPFGKGKNAVFRTIDHLGYVQIDTISVIKRAHHHVLATRVPGYRNGWLYELQQDKKVLEYWSHAAAFLPMEDYRFTLPIKNYFREHRDPWPKSDKKLMNAVLDRIKHEGPVMAKDFASDRVRKGQGWWDWKPAKLALERLFFQGSLVTVGRSGFQKIYDLPDNVIPDHIITKEPTVDEYAGYLIDRYLQSLGLATIAEITYQRKNIKSNVKKILDLKLEEGSVKRIDVLGVQNQEYFINSAFLEKSIRITPQIRILSPFDNLTIQRNRLVNFFEFDYQIECYVPEHKRKYGYFCLPLLYGDQFIGRLDAKADRKDKKLIIKNLHFEGKRHQKIDPMKYCQALQEFAGFNECNRIVLDKSNDLLLLDELKSLMAREVE
jgi:uncharacterized protein YcaQ